MRRSCRRQALHVPIATLLVEHPPFADQPAAVIRGRFKGGGLAADRAGAQTGPVLADCVLNADSLLGGQRGKIWKTQPTPDKSSEEGEVTERVTGGSRSRHL